MSRRIYVDTAAALRACRPAEPDSLSRPRRGMWATCVEAVAHSFARSNRAFDVARFMTDCGYKL